jgi:hypothetical protein
MALRSYFEMFPDASIFQMVRVLREAAVLISCRGYEDYMLANKLENPVTTAEPEAYKGRKRREWWHFQVKMVPEFLLEFGKVECDRHMTEDEVDLLGIFICPWKPLSVSVDSALHFRHRVYLHAAPATGNIHPVHCARRDVMLCWRCRGGVVIEMEGCRAGRSVEALGRGTKERAAVAWQSRRDIVGLPRPLSPQKETLFPKRKASHLQSPQRSQPHLQGILDFS